LAPIPERKSSSGGMGIELDPDALGTPVCTAGAAFGGVANFGAGFGAGGVC
jgi:hypothetical protein